MKIAPGTRIGPYVVVSLLGRGGMGEVWRARDERLRRDVAIKALPAALSGDGNLVARFEREARLLASLRHNAIAAVHGLEEQDGAHFMVMECVDGESLAQRLARGRIGLHDLLEILKQVAEGLEAAHAAGIIHRDLKPANIQVDDDSQARILDFGLARDDSPRKASDESFFLDAEASLPPTIDGRDTTSPGTLLGTVPYMSPEQARGQKVDRRTDIWSFGCVLYEGLTGSRPFSGESQADLLGSIIGAEPDLTLLPSDTPMVVVQLVRRCLAKDRRRRLQDIGDARIEIESALENPSQITYASGAPVGTARRAPIPALLPWLLSVAFAGLSAFLIVRPGRPGLEVEKSGTTVSPPAREPVRLRTKPPAPWLASQVRIRDYVCLSPEGRDLAFIEGVGSSSFQLHHRRLGELESRAIKSAANSFQPIFMPDGKRLIYLDAEGAMNRISIESGAPELLTKEIGIGPSCREDGAIAYRSLRSPDDGLRLLEPGTVVSRTITTVDGMKGELEHSFPSFIPGANRLLFTVVFRSETGRPPEIRLLDLADGSQRSVVTNGFGAQYLRTGHVVYQREGLLLAIRFDPEAGEARSSPVICAQDLFVDGMTWNPSYVASQNGRTIIYTGRPALESIPFIVDREGKRTPIVADEVARNWSALQPSPDGAQLAGIVEDDRGRSRIAIIDRERSTMRFVTEPVAYSTRPFWSRGAPDEIVYAGGESSLSARIRRVKFSGASPTETVIETKEAWAVVDWSADASRLLLASPDGTTEGAGFRELRLDQAGDPTPIPGLQLGRISWASYSPDGEWIAYSGLVDSRAELFLVTRRADSTPYQLTTRGGFRPTWSPDGKSIRYFDGERCCRALELELGERPRVIGSALLFQLESPLAEFLSPVLPDGERIVMREHEQVPEVPWTIILDFDEELRRLFE
ncbi:MAG: serine/threonine-protein kinase [Planctomycetes bacterium]|nr:serine/threonine-protein kinase [Planctomycetota bacterium]